jgi:hypothetical protein
MRQVRVLVACILVLACPACATVPFSMPSDGRQLVPGVSRGADVERIMGVPAQKLALAGGDSVWFYPRSPAGRVTYAVRLSSDGVVREVDQRLTEANVKKIVPGAMTNRDIAERFGPPGDRTWLPMQEREVWYYPMYDEFEKLYVLGVRFSKDGVVREVDYLPDPKENSGVP